MSSLFDGGFYLVMGLIYYKLLQNC